MKNIETLALVYLDAAGESEENAGIAFNTAIAILSEPNGAVFNSALSDSGFFASALYAANVVFESDGDGGIIDIPDSVTLDTVIESNPTLSPFRSFIRYLALNPLYSGDPTNPRAGNLSPSDY